jgi:pimeloyl-ACP methyl ester carboxylesterase
MLALHEPQFFRSSLIFPSSSHMFRNLIPLLSNRYFVIAPDRPRFGFTTESAEREYEYTFASLTHSMGEIISVHRGVEEVFPR